MFYNCNRSTFDLEADITIYQGVSCCTRAVGIENGLQELYIVLVELQRRY